MGGKRFFPTVIFAFLSLVIVQISSTAAASPAEEAIAGWFQNYKNGGATISKYDSVQINEATNTVTVKNPQIKWRLEFSTKEIPSYDISFSTARIKFVGVKQEAGGYSAKQVIWPDDVKFEVSGKELTGDDFTLEVIIQGAREEGVFHPEFTTAPEDPQRPVSRYLHYYDLLLKVAIKKGSYEKISVTQTLNGKENYRAEYNGITFVGFENGKTEEMRTKSYSQKMKFSETAGETPFDNMEVSYGEMLQRGVDLRPIVDALKGLGAGPDSDYRTITAQGSVSDMNILVGPANISIENYTVSGLKIRPGKTSLLAMFDRLALGEEIDEKELTATSFDFLRGFALDELSFTNLKGTGPANIAAAMGKFIIRNLSNQGLEKFAVEGLDVNGPGGEKVSFEHVTFADIVFPAVEEILAAVEQGPPDDPIAAAALAPKFGRVEIADLLVDDKIKPALSLGLLRILQSGFLGPIPTDIKIDIEDLNLPVAYIEDTMSQAVLQSLGYDVLKINSKIALKWQESSEELILENADISLDDGAVVTLKAGVTGVPRSVIENPQRFTEALTTLSFSNLNLLVEDAVLVSGLIDHFAKLQNMPPEALRALIVQIIESQAGPLTGTPFVEELMAALRSFLENPKRLSVDLNPQAPVPFTQMLGIVATAPDQLPAMLGANASAN